MRAAQPGESSRIVHPHVRGEESYSFSCDVRQTIETDFTKLWQSRQMRNARVCQPRTLPELEVFERGHAAQNLQAAISDPGLARIVRLQPRQARDMLGGRVARILAIHAPQTFEVFTAAHVTEPGVRHVHRQDLPERGKVR